MKIYTPILVPESEKTVDNGLIKVNQEIQT